MKSNLYTRTGDQGTTSLVDGSRARKDCTRIDAYGEIDELSSTLGLLAAGKQCPDEIRDEVNHIQHILFEIGGYLATPSEGADAVVDGLDGEISKLEGWIDALDERVPKLRSFILPGGCEESGRCHLARTVCRRAERRIISLAKESFVDPKLISYINRLSDYLFIAARYLNFITGVEEIVWKPRQEIGKGSGSEER